MMNPTFTVIEVNNDDGVCPGYALFSKDDYSVILIGNRALRRNPHLYTVAWDKVKEYVYEVYGYQPINPKDIRWVSKDNKGTTSFYKGDTLIGVMEQDNKGMILGSLDYRAPRDDVRGNHYPYNSLSRHWEDFGASL